MEAKHPREEKISIFEEVFFFSSEQSGVVASAQSTRGALRMSAADDAETMHQRTPKMRKRNRALLLAVSAAAALFLVFASSSVGTLKEDVKDVDVGHATATAVAVEQEREPEQEQEQQDTLIIIGGDVYDEDDGQEPPSPPGMDLEKAARLTLPNAFIPSLQLPSSSQEEEGGDTSSSSAAASTWLDDRVNPCYASGEGVKCVPYFYVLGAFHSGALDLFERLKQHPKVVSASDAPGDNGRYFSEVWCVGGGGVGRGATGRPTGRHPLIYLSHFNNQVVLRMPP
jgi:hypothetical protein